MKPVIKKVAVIVRNTMRALITIYIMLTAFVFAKAQCTLQGPFPVNDFDVFDLTLQIDSLSNDDLSDPLQGLCGVAISFNHDLVGDLLIELESPAGQSVTLVGPTGPFGLTNGTQWDISFVPCGASANPDLNFSDIYSNLNLWGNFASHSGSYYPYDGCLEDFNAGSANGLWKIKVRDAGQFYQGEIESVTLFFCDPSGVDCINCTAPLPEPSTDSLIVCREDTVPENVWTLPVSYDSTLHDIRFLISREDTIVEKHADVPFSIDLSPGLYDLCALAWDKRDSIFLENLTDTALLITNVIQTADSEGWCYGLSDCISLLVQDAADTTLQQELLCPGDSVFWRGQYYHEAGTYFEVDTNACFKVFSLQIDTPFFPQRLQYPDTIGCQQDSAWVSVHPFLPEYNYSWVVNTTDTLRERERIQLSRMDEAELIIAFASCSTILEIDVPIDTSLAEFSINYSDTLNCDTDSILVSASFTGSNAYFIVHGDTLSNTSFVVRDTQAFVFVVEAANGCSIKDTLTAPYNYTLPQAQINRNLPFCNGDSIPLSAIGAGAFFIWTGPSGFSANVRDTFGLDEGQYILRVIDSTSFCAQSDTAIFAYPPPLSLPTIMVDTLSCLQPEVQFDLDTIDPNLDYWWISPEGDTLQGPEPTVDLEGAYILWVRNTGNCIQSTQVEVIRSGGGTEFFIVGDTLDCNRLFVNLYTHLPKGRSNDSIRWIIPSLDTVIADTLVTALAGLYIAEWSDSSGCVLIDSFVLIENPVPVEPLLTADSLSCIQDSAEILIDLPAGYTFVCINERGDTVGNSPIVKVGESGSYRVIISGPSCQFIRSVEVEADTLSPMPDIRVKNKDCSSDSVGIDLLDPDLEWAIKQMESDTFAPVESRRFRTLNADSIWVQYTGNNGCSVEDVVLFMTDTQALELEIRADTLNCLQDSFQAVLATDIGVDRFSWVVNSIDTLLTDSVVFEVGTQLQYLYTGINGCTGSYNFIPIADTTVTPLNPELQDLNCERTSYTLQFPTASNYDSILWVPPFGTAIRIADSVRIEVAGRHVARLFASNGCSVSQQFIIEQDTQIVQPLLDNDTLNCNETSRRIIAAFDTSEVASFEWRQEGQTLNQDLFSQFEAGDYTFYWRMDNGCRDSLLIQLAEHEFKLPIETLPDEMTLNCRFPDTLLRVDSLDAYRSLQWILPSGQEVLSNDLLINTSGSYQFIAEDQNFCTDTQRINVEVDTAGVQLSTIDGLITCNSPFDTLDVQFQTIGELERVSWTGPNGFEADTLAPVVIDSGLYIVRLTLTNGCSASDTLRVEADLKGVDLNLADTTYLNCSSLQATLSFSAPVVGNSWFRNDSFISSDRSPRVSQSGTYVLIAEAENGCLSRDTIIVAEQLPFPEVAWRVPSLGCLNPTGSFQALNLSENLEWSWQGPGEFQSILAEPEVSDTGQYIVSYINEFDCISRDTLLVEGFNLRPSLSWRILDTARCEDSTHLIELFLEDTSDLESTIIALSGNVSPANFPNQYHCSASGRYAVQATRTAESCVAQDTFTLPEPIIDAPMVNVVVNDIWCDRDTLGSIRLTANPDFRAPFRYQLDDTGWDSIGDYRPLLEGVYNWVVQDRYGCEIDGSAEVINRGSTLAFDLGPDIETVRGQEFVFQPMTNISENQFVTKDWIFNGRPVCDTCSSITQIVRGPFKLQAEWITAGGCIVSDEVIVTVPTDQILFVPNVFTPDENGNNDFFYVQSSSEIETIELLQIFDRWGNQLFECRNCPVNDITVGWDGTFEGEPMVPQVLSVLLIYEYQGERVIEYKDLTLIR